MTCMLQHLAHQHMHLANMTSDKHSNMGKQWQAVSKSSSGTQAASAADPNHSQRWCWPAPLWSTHAYHIAKQCARVSGICAHARCNKSKGQHASNRGRTDAIGLGNLCCQWCDRAGGPHLATHTQQQALIEQPPCRGNQKKGRRTSSALAQT